MFLHYCIKILIEKNFDTKTILNISHMIYIFGVNSIFSQSKKLAFPGTSKTVLDSSVLRCK